jgi:hypothetical protein
VFVRKNDQVNARVVFQTLQGVFAQFQATASREGIVVPNIGGWSMDIQKLFNVGMQGLSLIQTLSQQGKDVMPVITSLTNIFSKRPDQVTDQELDDTEKELDEALDEFEKPMNKLGG